MAADGPAPDKGARFMFVLTGEEMEEMRLAMAARARAMGSGTIQHKRCNTILRKLTESEGRPNVIDGMSPYLRDLLEGPHDPAIADHSA